MIASPMITSPMITSPLASYYFWQKWTDQTLRASADFFKRANSLTRLQAASSPHVAQTPADVIYTENKLRLLRYQSTVARAAESQYSIPLLIVPSIINRYYVLDLKPGRSLVEHLRARGFDVWMIDWGTPGEEDRFVTFDYHIEGYLRHCVECVLDATRQSELSLLGYCIGGVLTTVFAALHGERIKNLINLAAPINFHDDGLLSQWARAENFPVDLLIDVYGNMPASLLQPSFKWLKPTTEARNCWTLWERLDQPERLNDFLALNQWAEDNVAVPGETYRKFVKDCYQNNLLMQNRMMINGRTVDLRAIQSSLLNITARQDHICPCDSAAVLNELVSSQDKEVMTLRGGHVGAIVGREASETLYPKLADWLAARSGL